MSPSVELMTPLHDRAYDSSGYRSVRGHSPSYITAETLATMSQHVYRAVGDRWGRFQRLTQKLNGLETVKRAFQLSKQYIIYTPDSVIAEQKGYPKETEVLINPLLFLERRERNGDCDDFSMFIATMCKAKGLYVRWVVIRESHSSEWNHVYVAVYVDGLRIAIDGAFGKYEGWEVTDDIRYNVVDRMEIDV